MALCHQQKTDQDIVPLPWILSVVSPNRPTAIQTSAVLSQPLLRFWVCPISRTYTFYWLLKVLPCIKYQDTNRFWNLFSGGGEVSDESSTLWSSSSKSIKYLKCAKSIIISTQQILSRKLINLVQINQAPLLSVLFLLCSSEFLPDRAEYSKVMDLTQLLTWKTSTASIL